MNIQEAEEGTASYSLEPWLRRNGEESKGSGSDNNAQAAVVAAATTPSSNSIRTAPPPPYNYLTLLPMELQLEILDHVDLPSLIQLRRTSRLYRSVLITRSYLVRRFPVTGGISSSPLQFCCSQCMTIPPKSFLLTVRRNHLGFNDGRYDIENETIEGGWWNTMCHRCWRSRLPSPSKRLAAGSVGMTLHEAGSFLSLGICNFCGWPCQEIPRMHKKCDAPRFWLRLIWFVLGVVQFTAGIVGGGAAWANYGDDPRIKIPSTINFALLWISWITVGFRVGFDTGFYKWPLALEFVQAILWLPPLIANAQWECDPYFPVCDPFIQFSLAAYAVAFAFRAMNVISYTMLALDYDYKNIFLPDLSIGKKIKYVLAACLVWWAVVA